MKKEVINDLQKKSIQGILKEEVTMHLGGAVYVTISPKFPTVDIRHFWKPDNSDTPVATKKGIALSKYMWERLTFVMQVMRDFVPELDKSCTCYYLHSNETEALSCKECFPFNEEVSGMKLIMRKRIQEVSRMKRIMMTSALIKREISTE